MADVEDKLSSLPDDILVDILSHLPVNYAAATSVLSTRWRFLRTRINRVVLDKRFFPFPYMIPKTLFIHIFEQLTCSKFLAFKLNFPYFSVPNSLIHQLSQRPVQDIEIDLNVGFKDLLIYRYDQQYSPTIAVFALDNRHVVVLKLCGRIKIDIVNLPNLEELYLSVESLSCEAFNNLIKSSPKLKKLLIFGSITEISTSSFCLASRRLEYLNVCASVDYGEFAIDTPNLKHLELDSILKKYHFVSKPHELIRAEIGLHRAIICHPNNDSISQGLETFGEISNVTDLTIDADTVQAVKMLNDDGRFPDFKSLMTLTIEFAAEYFNCWSDILFSAQSFTRLEHLRVNQHGPFEIEWVEPSLNVFYKRLPRLKTIKLGGVRGTADEVAVITYILTTVKTLELLAVAVDPLYFNNEEDAEQFRRQLLPLLKPSANCEIKLLF